MKHLLTTFLLIASLSSYAGDEGSTGAGNGGQTVYVGNNAYLRDIVENNNCNWKTNAEIIQTIPKLGDILKKMKSLNSSFTLRIQDEIKNLGYCFTTKRLPYLQYNNSDDIHIFPNEEYDQVAINDSGIVFIDLTIFEKMDATNKSFLFLHEAAHELFDKKEERFKREPRLREFLMNMFKQLDFLAQNANSEGFNYIITSAHFTALEDVFNVNHEDFEAVFVNAPTTSLARKVKAIKALNYAAAAPICLKDCKLILFSKTLKENLKNIEAERVATVQDMITKINYRSNIENFNYLTKEYKNIAQYLLNDEAKIDGLTKALKYMLQTYDLTSYEQALPVALSLINVVTTTEFYGGFIAKNYDSVVGPGTYGTALLKNADYLNTAIFGSIYKTAVWKKDRCYSCNDKYVTYLSSYKKLENNQDGLIQDIEGKTELNRYMLEEVKMNSVFKDNVVARIESDMKKVEETGLSAFLLPNKMEANDHIIVKRKRNNIKEQAKFKGSAKNDLLKKYEETLKILK